MGVDLATYRARIGCFSNPGHDSLHCWAEASCLLVWLVMSQLMLKLAGDVEENPGPKERFPLESEWICGIDNQNSMPTTTPVPAKQFEYCRKKNRHCSKPKGHLSKCDSKRPLEHQGQMWKAKALARTKRYPRENDNTEHHFLQPSAQPVPTQAQPSAQPVLTQAQPSAAPILVEVPSYGSSEVKAWEYASHVRMKRKRDIEQLMVNKSELEREITTHEAQLQRYRQEAAGWQEAHIRIVRQHEQVKYDLDLLAQKEARLNARATAIEAKYKEAVQLDEKVRKVLEQKGCAKTKVDQNPTTVDMMNKHTDTWYRRRKLSRECLECVNGGKDGAIVAAFGVLVELASFEQIDQLMTSYKKGKYWQLKFNSVTKKYEASVDNMETSIAAKFRGEFSRRKYQFHCKTLSTVYDPEQAVYLPRNTNIDGVNFRQTRLVSNSKLQAAINKMDIGHIHPVPGHVGATRPLVSLVHMMVDLHLRLPGLRKELRWFNGKKNHFIIYFADDGTPETKDSSMCVATLSCWNFGSKTRSREYQYLLHIINESEKSPVVAELWGEHLFQIRMMISKAYTIAGELCTFEFRAGGDESWAATALGETSGAATYPSPWANVTKTNMFIVGGKIGVTWKPWTMEQRDADLLKLGEYKKSLPPGLSESARRNKRNEFMAANGMRQLRPPLIGEYASTFYPDCLHVELNISNHWYDLMYQEAVRRDRVKEFTDVTAAPISLSNARNEPAQGKNLGKYTSTVSHEAVGDRVRHDGSINVQSDNMYSKLEAHAKKTQGEYSSLVGLGMKAIAARVLEHDANKTTRHRKLGIRFIGDNAIRTLRYGHRLVDSLATPDEDEKGKIVREVLGTMIHLLRDAASIYNKHETTEAELTEMERLLDLYYNLFCLFLPERANLTVWTVAKAIPHYARKLYDEYGVGYGVVSMQGKEAKNAKVKEYLKLTNHSKEEGKCKFTQVFRSEYMTSYYLQEHSPLPSQYRPHFNPRVPSEVGTPGFCNCGREIVRSDVDSHAEEDSEDQVSLCTFCLGALEVVACAKEGELSPRLLDILLPAMCEVCECRFADNERMAEHMKAAHLANGGQRNPLQTTQVSEASINPRNMKKPELVAELKKRGLPAVGGIKTLRGVLHDAITNGV